MSRKKSKSASKPFFSKKKKGFLIKLIFISALAGASYTIYDPSLISNQEKRDQVIAIKQDLVDKVNKTLKDQDLPPILARLGSFSRYLPQGAVLGNQEIIVEDQLEQLTSHLKTLPAQQLDRLKTDLCADLVREATSSSQPLSP